MVETKALVGKKMKQSHNLRLLFKQSMGKAFEGAILQRAGKAWLLVWMAYEGVGWGKGVLYCMAGKIWASVFGLAIMRSSLAALVVNSVLRDCFKCHRFGHLVWRNSVSVTTLVSFFFHKQGRLYMCWRPRWLILNVPFCNWVNSGIN